MSGSDRILCTYVAVVHVSHRHSLPVSRHCLCPMHCGTYRVGSMFSKVCASSNRKKVKFCLPILSVCNAHAAVIRECVYSGVWEGKCLDERMVGNFLPLSVRSSVFLVPWSCCGVWTPPTEAVQVIHAAGSLKARRRLLSCHPSKDHKQLRL